MKKKYIKSTSRLFLHHIVRLLSISAIFLVSLTLISGIYSVVPSIKETINTTYNQGNVHDFSIIQTADKIASIKDKVISHLEYCDLKEIDESAIYDTPSEEIGHNNHSKRITLLDFDNYKIDKLTLLDGRYPDKNHSPIPGSEEDYYEVVANEGTKEVVHHNINDIVSYKITTGEQAITLKFKIVGLIKNPTMLAEYYEPSMLYISKDKPDYLDDMFYLDKNTNDPIIRMLWQFIPHNLVMTYNENMRNNFNSFSSTYKNQNNIHVERLRQVVGIEKETDIKILTLYENYAFNYLNITSDKINVLAIIFIIFFILIAVLVVYSTMARLLDEERSNMAVLKTLGYSNFLIGARYVVFATIAAIIGIAIAYFPANLITKIILNALAIQFRFNTLIYSLSYVSFIIVSAIVLLSCLIFTALACYKTTKDKPIELLTPKTPRAGDKILLEKVKSIWSRLSFKYKSTCRNVFRFKSRFFMTVLSVLAATMLVFASFAVLNNAMKIENLSTLKTIAYVLLVFSGALCAVVVYNITNINISERTREIATLMVLGYRNNEVTGYIYREIYVMSAIAALIGLPAGVGFTQFLFVYCDFGKLYNVEWWSYLLTPIVTLVFAVLSTRLLHHKIVKINMNDSLKVLE